MYRCGHFLFLRSQSPEQYRTPFGDSQCLQQLVSYVSTRWCLDFHPPVSLFPTEGKRPSHFCGSYTSMRTELESEATVSSPTRQRSCERARAVQGEQVSFKLSAWWSIVESVGMYRANLT